jgi:hypothetical protein
MKRKIGPDAEGGGRMNVGERVKFQFGGKEKEGVVIKIFPKKVYLKVDFPRHPGKMILRSIAALEGRGPASPKKKRKEKQEKEKKEKIQPPQERMKEEARE